MRELSTQGNPLTSKSTCGTLHEQAWVRHSPYSTLGDVYTARAFSQKPRSVAQAHGSTHKIQTIAPACEQATLGILHHTVWAQTHDVFKQAGLWGNLFQDSIDPLMIIDDRLVAGLLFLLGV